MKTTEYKPSTIKLAGWFNQMLDEIAESRKEKGDLVYQKAKHCLPTNC